MLKIATANITKYQVARYDARTFEYLGVITNDNSTPWTGSKAQAETLAKQCNNGGNTVYEACVCYL